MKVADNQEQRIRALEDDRLITRTEKNYQRAIDERNQRRRTEFISWFALATSIVSILLNVVDRLT